MSSRRKKVFRNHVRMVFGGGAVLAGLAGSAGLGLEGDAGRRSLVSVLLTLVAAVLAWLTWINALVPRVELTTQGVTHVGTFRTFRVPWRLVAEFTFDTGVELKLKSGRLHYIDAFNSPLFHGLPGHPYLRTRCRALNEAIRRAEFAEAADAVAADSVRRVKERHLTSLALFLTWGAAWAAAGLVLR